MIEWIIALYPSLFGIALVLLNGAASSTLINAKVRELVEAGKHLNDDEPAVSASSFLGRLLGFDRDGDSARKLSLLLFDFLLRSTILGASLSALAGAVLNVVAMHSSVTNPVGSPLSHDGFDFIAVTLTIAVAVFFLFAVIQVFSREVGGFVYPAKERGRMWRWSLWCILANIASAIPTLHRLVA